jgi:hypothetical protein
MQIPEKVHSDPSLLTSWLRLASAVAAFAAPACTNAELPNLVDHNGFEACWSKAATAAQFLDSQQASIEGAVFCMPQSSAGNSINGYSVCNNQLCPGAATGCPVTMRSGPFNGTFLNGATIFNASGTADNITVDVQCKAFGIPGSCNLTVSNVSFGYSLNYTLQPDGNDGLDAVSLDQATLAVNDGYTFGSCGCSGVLDQSAIITTIVSPGSARIAELEAAANVGESVCPLIP